MDTNTDNRADFSVRLLAYMIDKAVLLLIDMVFISISIIISAKAGIGGEGKNIFSITAQNIETIISQYIIIFIPLYIFIMATNMGYYVYFIGLTGQTIGKKIMNIKVVLSSDESSEGIGYAKAFIRWIGYLASSAPLWLGFLWILFDNKKEGWHDKIAGTCVINEQQQGE